MTRWHVVSFVNNQEKQYTSLGKPLTEKEATTFLSKMTQSNHVHYCLEKVHNNICGITIGVMKYSPSWGAYRMQYYDICQKNINHEGICNNGLF